MTLVYQYGESHFLVGYIHAQDSRISYSCQKETTERKSKYLGVSAFAKHVGLTDSTIQSYFLKGMLPIIIQLATDLKEEQAARSRNRSPAPCRSPRQSH